MKVIDGGFPKKEDEQDRVADMFATLAELAAELTAMGVQSEAVVVLLTDDGVTVAASKQDSPTITYLLNLGIHATLNAGFNFEEEDDHGPVH
jgi:hypothetical protein